MKCWRRNFCPQYVRKTEKLLIISGFLSVYLYDGELEIDNNLVENALRPLTLGRKNYLFAGTHEAAQRAAMIYSFFAICKKHEVNPYQWLKYALENIMVINHKNIKELYPQNFKLKQEA